MTATPREVQVELLIGRAVHDSTGARLGRLAEIVARKEDDELVVASYIVGPMAWFHRFAVAGLGLRMRGLGRVYRVAWEQMDLSEPKNPRTTCPRGELAREDLPRRRRGLTRRPARRLA